MSADIAASLQTSLEQCSLDHHPHTAIDGGSGFGASNSSSDSITVELNSNTSLPYHWEQCLDLKTGEVYYINWRTGMKAKEDPRTTGDHGYFYSDEDEDEDEDESSYSGSGSSSDSSSAVSSSKSKKENKKEANNVLVVAGCKRCLMYLMVAKQVEECPKCSAQLLHFH